MRCWSSAALGLCSLGLVRWLLLWCPALLLLSRKLLCGGLLLLLSSGLLMLLGWLLVHLILLLRRGLRLLLRGSFLGSTSFCSSFFLQYVRPRLVRLQRARWPPDRP